MKQPKTKTEINDYIRSKLGKGEVKEGELSDSQMDEFIRSRGEVPEKKAPPPKQLTPAQVVQVLELIDNEHLTYAQAKAKVFEDEAKAATESKSMNGYIRSESGRTVNENGTDQE